MRPALSPDQRAAVIAWTSNGVSAVEQARRLGLKYINFCMIRQCLARRGLLTIRRRPRPPRWTPDQVDLLHQLIQSGYSYDRIARRLNRSRVAIVIKCKRLGCRLLRAVGVYTCRSVAELLGVGCSKTVGRWITLGWLKARDGGTAGASIWRIKQEDLWAFLEQPEYWMAWYPERITDPDLREWAQELRAGKPQWLSIGAVARCCFVDGRTVNKWIHLGVLPSVRYGNHWVSEAALAGFVPPCERPRQARRRKAA